MEENMNEIWKPVFGYEGLYQVSNLGRVRSLPREWIGGKGSMRKHNGKILKAAYQNGYCLINLYKEGKHKSITIHKLVAMTFLGHIPDGHNIVVDHIDNNPSNNRLDNLQLITNRENLSKDKVGTSKYCGVCWKKSNQKWQTQITINGVQTYLGYFHNEEEASQMYQLALSNIDKYNGSAKEFREYLNSL